MCMTSARARLSNTLIYSGTARRQGKDVHVLAYQNTADSDGPNAMILPFPAAEAMDENNILDTTSYKSFLKDISESTKIRTRSLGMANSRSFSKSAKVFDVGSYTVVLAESVFQIPEALSRVPEVKRPNVTSQFLIGFGKLYPDRPIALCCWDGNIKAEPLLWWYVPSNKDVLFVPTMDAHDGNAPDVNAMVETDHIISVGSALPDQVGHHHQVDYSAFLPLEAAELLPAYVYGTKVNSRVKNGDMFVDAQKLGRGTSARDVPKISRGLSISPDGFEMYGWS